MPFTRKLSHTALYKLEQYDETLADICQSSHHDAASSAHSIDDTYNPASIDNSYSSTTICSYDHHDLKQLEHLGSGAYCTVNKVTNSSCPEAMAKKTIDPNRLRCRRDLDFAAGELANEAKILAGLDHDNIIKLRGVSNEKFSQSFVSGKGGFFLVMDMLNESLRDRLDRERTESKHKNSDNSIAKKKAFSFFRKSTAACTKSQTSPRKQLHNRVEETALGIARGMKYLHSKDIVLRDLKPDNIGFENSTYDVVKLFDFGMASKVQDCDPNEICGSPRYMAPEVMTGEGYTLAVDVYSFGVILYELCSLNKPYEVTFDKIQRKLKRRRRNRSKSRNESILEFYQTVVDHELRPYDNLEDEICCPKLCCLIEACCQHDPTQRPSFDYIESRLVEIFYPELFAPDHIEEENENRESTGKRSSVSIEFDSDCEILANNER